MILIDTIEEIDCSHADGLLDDLAAGATIAATDFAEAEQLMVSEIKLLLSTEAE